ncbi:hypothetical protein XENOCAPTIV_005673, partial [Xenoophorus captivus]
YRKDMEDLPSTLYSLLPETLETQFVKEMAETHSEESGKESMSSSLYAQLPQTSEMELAAKVSELLSEVKHHTSKYKEDGMKSRSQSLYSQLPETTETNFAINVSELQSQVKYREGKKDLNTNLYSQLPETDEMKFAKAVMDLQSEYKKDTEDLANTLYSLLPETLESQFFKEMAETHSEVCWSQFVRRFMGHQSVGLLQKAYREEGKKEAGHSLYAQMPQTIETVFAKEVTKAQSDVSYRKGKEELHHFNPVPDRLDIISATNASKLVSHVGYKSNTKQPVYTDQSLLARTDILHAKEVKYKESFDRQLKDQKPCYNPMDCVSFKHTQAAAALASQVGGPVKYKEEYEKNKGRSLMEYGDTQAYKVSKEAQKMQSEREYRRDFEEQVKGKALLDVDQTPGYLTARHASSLLSEKAYKKDLEQEVKGRGLSGVGLEETPELLRVKKANQILNQKEYRRDLETEIMGKGMELSADVLEIQRAKRASDIQSQVSGSRLTPSRWFITVCIKLHIKLTSKFARVNVN